MGKISVYKRGFCYSNVPTTETRPYVSTANEAVVGTLMTIGDVKDIIAITISRLHLPDCSTSIRPPSNTSNEITKTSPLSRPSPFKDLKNRSPNQCH